MLKIGFGNRVKNRTFDYKPRFYDPDKEAFQERMEMLREKYADKAEIDGEKMKLRIRQGFKNKGASDPSYRSKMEKTAAVRRLVIVGVLLLIVYLFSQSDRIEQFLRLLYQKQ